MNGKFIGSFLVAFSLVFGAVFFYFQTFAYYERLSSVQAISIGDKQIPVSNYQGIESPISPLKFRSCFSTDFSNLAKTPPVDYATPLVAPFWFKCFDAGQLKRDIGKGLALSFLALENEESGFDRLVAVYPDGRAYEWRQLNRKYLE